MTVGDAIRAYSVACPVPASTERRLDTLEGDLGAHKLHELTCAWAHDWIRCMKREHHIDPGRMRKKIRCALARASLGGVDAPGVPVDESAVAPAQ
jgi:hypothetical protein